MSYCHKYIYTKMLNILYDFKIEIESFKIYIL